MEIGREGKNRLPPRDGVPHITNPQIYYDLGGRRESVAGRFAGGCYKANTGGGDAAGGHGFERRRADLLCVRGGGHERRRANLQHGAGRSRRKGQLASDV
ncbi:hypothetical protein VPH35_018567 [Triticum aestivum]